MSENEKYLGKYSQQGIKYMDTGRGDKKCSSCKNFLLEKANNREGCLVVADVKHGDGWCRCWRQKNENNNS